MEALFSSGHLAYLAESNFCYVYWGGEKSTPELWAERRRMIMYHGRALYTQLSSLSLREILSNSCSFSCSILILMSDRRPNRLDSIFAAAERVSPRYLSQSLCLSPEISAGKRISPFFSICPSVFPPLIMTHQTSASAVLGHMHRPALQIPVSVCPFSRLPISSARRSSCCVI